VSRHYALLLTFYVLMQSAYCSVDYSHMQIFFHWKYAFHFIIIVKCFTYMLINYGLYSHGCYIYRLCDVYWVFLTKLMRSLSISILADDIITAGRSRDRWRHQLTNRTASAMSVYSMPPSRTTFRVSTPFSDNLHVERHTLNDGWLLSVNYEFNITSMFGE